MTRTLNALVGMGVGLAVAAAGCQTGDGGVGDGNGANDSTEFTASLDGSQEVPAVDTEATGAGDATLSADEQELAFRFTAAGLSGPVIAAHFHQGPTGVDGDIVVDVSADVSQVDDEVTIDGSAAVEADFVEALRNGEIYVNLHTDLNPGGEIRGQMEESPTSNVE